MLRARSEARKAELNDQLKDVINEWRKNRAKEEEELKRVSSKRYRLFILTNQSPFTLQSVSCQRVDNHQVYWATSAAYKINFTLVTIAKVLE